jgi:hypothetical protein
LKTVFDNFGANVKVALRKLTKLIKSEPVLFIALLAVLAQAAQKAMDTGHFTFTVWITYAFQMFMALVARELVVPGTKHTEVKASLGEAVAAMAIKHRQEIDKAYTKGVNRGLRGD